MHLHVLWADGLDISIVTSGCNSCRVIRGYGISIDMLSDNEMAYLGTMPGDEDGVFGRGVGDDVCNAIIVGMQPRFDSAVRCFTARMGERSECRGQCLGGIGDSHIDSTPRDNDNDDKISSCSRSNGSNRIATQLLQFCATVCSECLFRSPGRCPCPWLHDATIIIDIANLVGIDMHTFSLSVLFAFYVLARVFESHGVRCLMWLCVPLCLFQIGGCT